MRRRLALEAGKWLQTMRISWSERMAYKLHFVLLVLGPTLVFFFVKYSLWSSIFETSGVERISGYDLRGMLGYQAWVMLVSLLAQSYNSMSLAEDIRLGRISAYLIYPFEFWQFHTAGFLSLQALQLLISAVTFGCVRAFGWVEWPGAEALAAGVAMSLLVGLFWFVVNSAFGLMAFWLEETWVLRVMFVTLSGFLSGAVLPLEIYPAWLRAALEWTPFPYVTFVPVKIFQGQYTGGFWTAAALVAAWTAAACLVARWIWRRGLHLYTAAGM